jgi:hypothetical protein
MTEERNKAWLLENIRAGYTSFEELLASLSNEQKTTPGVNGKWSVKDNLAHLTAWHTHLADGLEAILAGREFVEKHPGLSEDEVNEVYYQENKNRPLADVEADFRASYQRVLSIVGGAEEQKLHQPEDRPLGGWVAGNTFGHYEEHGKFIRDWLARQ